MQLSAGKIKHLNALSNSKGVIAAAAMDQRGSLRKSIASAKGVPQEQITDEMMAGVQGGGLEDFDATRQRHSSRS